MSKILLTFLALAWLAPSALGKDAPAKENADQLLEARESNYYQIITLPTPPDVMFEAGALQFLGRDKLACSTRIGDIWIGTGVLSDPPTPKWTLFASGLHDVLGLALRDGWLYATQRGEVTRLKDTHHSGRADVVETVCDDWGINGNYHEYAFSSKFDREGYMWVLLTLTGSSSSESMYRGWGLRVNPEGKAIPSVCGIRSPGGVGFNAEGDCFYTDNQGEWNGACRLQWLRPGSFAGHPASLRWFDAPPESKKAIADAGLKKPAEPKNGSIMYDEAKRIPQLQLPSVYFPYKKMGQSASGIACDLTGKKFGPFSKQLFVGDQCYATVMRVYLENIGHDYQGACFPFRRGFLSGNLALEFADDGSLFIFSTERGWGGVGGHPFALQRLRWTGRTPFEIETMKARPDGFEFSFTKPIAPESAVKTNLYSLDAYTYNYTSGYGSPETKQTKPKITGIKVGKDAMTVRLTIAGLVPGDIHELHLSGIKSADGEPLLHDAAYYTLNKIPAK